MILDLKQIIQKLQRGDCVAVPTDTVYGLAVNPADPAAVEQLFRLKGRDQAKKIPLLVPSMAAASDVLDQIPAPAAELVQRFWPGPLTLVLPAASSLSVHLKADDGTIGVRMPDCEPLLELLRQTGPLAVTSANRSGQPPASSIQEIEALFGADFPILEGAGGGGVPSTIVRYRDSGWQLLREGKLSLQELGIA